MNTVFTVYEGRDFGYVAAVFARREDAEIFKDAMNARRYGLTYAVEERTVFERQPPNMGYNQ